jgi:polysaccharide biosynthesis protein PslH
VRSDADVRIVYICQWNPWSLSGGALIRNAWLIRTLALRYPIDLVTADDPSTKVPPEFAAACSSISRFPRAAGNSGRLERALKAMRSRASFYTSGGFAAGISEKVAELMARGDSVAMVDLRMIDALAKKKHRFVYNAHNVEHRLLRRRADHEPQPLRSLIRWEAERLTRIEAGAVRNALFVAACSENDRRELIQLAPEASSNIFVVPNSIDTEHYATVANATGEPHTILITGSYDWRPNQIGLDWFLSEVLPILRSRTSGEDYRIRVAGRMSAEFAEKLAQFSGITAVPNPTDMRDELQRARIVAAPILASSGTRLRVLEAWAAGRPVVTTTAGALGLAYQDMQELIVADRPAEFADAITRVLDEDMLWQNVRDAALRQVRIYDWRTVGEKFLNQTALLLDPKQDRSAVSVP